MDDRVAIPAVIVRRALSGGSNALLIGALGAATGWVATRGYVAVAVAVAVLAPLVAVVAGLHAASRVTVARTLLWVGLIAPSAVTHVRTQADVESAPLNALAVAQVAIPVACLASAWLLTPVRLLPLTPVEGLLVLYLAVALVSGFWAVSTQATELKALQLSVSYALVLVTVRSHSLPDLLSWLVGIVQVLVITSLIGLAASPGRALAPIDEFVSVPRLKGLFPAIGPDLLGFVAAIALVAMVFRVGPRWTQGWLVRGSLIAADLGVLLLSRSRTALALILVGIVVGAVADARTRVRAVLVGVPAMVLALLAFALLSARVVGFLYRGQSQEAFTTLTGRTEIWSTALTFWERSPIVGYGYYSGHRLGDFADAFPFETTNIDNMWLETLLDLGILGLLPLAGFVVAGIALAFSRRATGPHELLLRPLLAMCIVSSLFNPSLQQPGYTMIVFSIVLLALPVTRATPEPPPPAS